MNSCILIPPQDPWWSTLPMKRKGKVYKVRHLKQRTSKSWTYSVERSALLGVCSSGSLIRRVLLGRNDFNMWDSMLKFKDLLPKETRLEFSLVDEGKSIARASLQAALDAADLVARSMASAVARCRSSWLHSSDLPQEVPLRSSLGGSFALFRAD